MVVAQAAVIGWNLYQEYRAGKRPHWSMIWGVVVFTFFALFLLSLDYPQIPAKIVAVLGLHLTQFLAVFIVFVLGFAASEFKLHGKLYYGIVEVFFGMISSVAVVTRVHFTPVAVSQMSLAQVTALVGSVYVVARGFANIHEAKHSNPKFQPGEYPRVCSSGERSRSAVLTPGITALVWTTLANIEGHEYHWRKVAN